MPVRSTHLSGGVKELVYAYLDLVEQYGVYGGVELVADQLLDVALDLCAELLIVAHQQLQHVPDEPRIFRNNMSFFLLLGSFYAIFICWQINSRIHFHNNFGGWITVLHQTL